MAAGIDIAIDRMITDTALAEEFARAIDVRSDEVLVAPDFFSLTLEELDAVERTRQDGDYRALLQVARSDGEFPLAVELAFYDHQLDPVLLDSPKRDKMLRQLAHALGARLLVDDGGVNPYTFRLVAEDGEITPVQVDADKLDNENTLVIVEPVSLAIQRDLIARR